MFHHPGQKWYRLRPGNTGGAQCAGLDLQRDAPSGLHLVCIMYAGMKSTTPELDAGFDLAAEYQAAVSLFEAKAH